MTTAPRSSGGRTLPRQLPAPFQSPRAIRASKQLTLIASKASVAPVAAQSTHVPTTAVEILGVKSPVSTIFWCIWGRFRGQKLPLPCTPLRGGGPGQRDTICEWRDMLARWHISRGWRISRVALLCVAVAVPAQPRGVPTCRRATPRVKLVKGKQ